MLDFRLQVFYTVAKRLSFTRAATELFISQPAVTKHIKELELAYKTTLFNRSGNKKMSLTPAGKVLLNYAEQLNALYGELEYDMNLLNKAHGGILRIGASTTVAQYILPKALALFHHKFTAVQVRLITGNTEDIERALLSKDIEVGIIEGISKNPQLSYKPYLRDELVLVAATGNKRIKKEMLKPEDLKNYPLVLREPGSGTLEVIAGAFLKHKIKLADLWVEMQLGGTESIKSYLLNSEALAFLSIHAILKELKNNQLTIIDVKGMMIERTFHFITPHGQASSLSELFMKFARNLTLD
ncbi:DNA-binding transcriptional LysR family regulator [Pedobacter sp. UYP30]|uniref:LysR family transcriptional regulator n=1 Tax=Pedobacter sp. UYP30 TaxID=1756400 RepID=UPI003394880E